MSKLFAVCVLSWAAMTGCAAAQRTHLEERGREIARSNCATCHAVGRTGESPRREAPAFRTLSRNFPVSDLEEALAEGISSGSPIMPEFQFSADDAHALVTYLQSIQDRHLEQPQTGQLPRPIHGHPQ